jgi:hypothetical protein
VTFVVKWEYTSIALVKGQKDAGLTTDVQLLNKYGSEGWELVSVVYARVDLIAYFKRATL